MKTLLKNGPLGASLLCAGVVSQMKKQTIACVQIWSGYDEGWAVRTATTTTLKAEEHRVYLVTLYEGNEYKISVCGDKYRQCRCCPYNANGDERRR